MQAVVDNTIKKFHIMLLGYENI